MRRVLSVYLAHWPTDRLRREAGQSAPPPDKPLVLQGMIGRRRVITAVDGLALKKGIRVGMPVAKAQILIEGLEVRDADPDADEAALERLSVWALRHYSPLVAPDGPDGLVLDVTGAAHLFGGEAGLVTHMLTQLGDREITAYAALTDSRGAAHALARFGGRSSVIVATGKTAEQIKDLPPEALRLPADMVADLKVMGFDTIGEIAAQPRAPLTLRFGPELWRRIDMAFDRMPEPIEPVEAPELISVSRLFAEPIGAAETIEKYTRRLTEALCLKLETAGLGVRRLDMHCVRVDNRIETITVATARPVRDVKRLSRLLCDKIDTIDPGFGIEKMVLSAPLVEALSAAQTITSASGPDKPDVTDLWDTLTNRYGPDRLYRAVPVATDIPERAVKRLPPTSQDKGSLRASHYRRPPRLYRPPEPVQALAALPDHPPRAFSWRGQRYSVVCADGPERIKGEWWRTEGEAGKVRDYYILEVESGERFWVFRAGDGVNSDTGSLNWYLHGKFD